MRDDSAWEEGPSDRNDRGPRESQGFERATEVEQLRMEGHGFPEELPERYRDHEIGLWGPARYGLGPYHERLLRRQRPDQELKAEVEEAIFYDTWVDADAISVEVTDGVVTLTGELSSYDEVRFATDDAWDVVGVIGVRCRLTVDES